MFRNASEFYHSSLSMYLGLNKKRKLSRQASAGWRSSIEKMFTRSKSTAVELSTEERESRFENIVKSNFGKQNFLDIFLFRSPNLFYNLIIFVITCNSLYLAWWATNFLFVILKLDGSLHQLVLTLVSLIPH